MEFLKRVSMFPYTLYIIYFERSEFLIYTWTSQ